MNMDEVGALMVALLRKIQLGRRGMVVLISLALLMSMLMLYAFYNLNPIMLSMAEAKARQLAVQAINQAVREVVAGDVTYSDLVKVQQDAGGRVTMLQANTLLMNELASQTALVAQRNLAEFANEGVELPLGAAFGVDLVSGMGPRFRVNVVPVGSVTTRFVTAFESAGINQTRHEISLEASVLMRIVIPAGANTVSVNAYVPVAESIIVGEVPESYVNAPGADSMLDLNP